MRVAAIYDIHANLPALEAVLGDIHQAKVDQIVVGGDVLPGPMPRETLECLLALTSPVQFIYGNGERAVLDLRAGRDPVTLPAQYRGIVRWSAEQLDGEHERVLGGWPCNPAQRKRDFYAPNRGSPACARPGRTPRAPGDLWSYPHAV